MLCIGKDAGPTASAFMFLGDCVMPEFVSFSFSPVKGRVPETSYELVVRIDVRVSKMQV